MMVPTDLLPIRESVVRPGEFTIIPGTGSTRFTELPRGITDDYLQKHCMTCRLRAGSTKEGDTKYPDIVDSLTPVLAGAPAREVLNRFAVRRNLCEEMERRIQQVANYLGVRAVGPEYDTLDNPPRHVRILPVAMRHLRANNESVSGSGLRLTHYLPRMTSEAFQLCGKWNARACADPGPDCAYAVCQKLRRIHACLYCLGPHRIDDCPGVDFNMDQIVRVQAQRMLTASQRPGEDPPGINHAMDLTRYGQGAAGSRG